MTNRPLTRKEWQKTQRRLAPGGEMVSGPEGLRWIVRRVL